MLGWLIRTNKTCIIEENIILYDSISLARVLFCYPRALLLPRDCPPPKFFIAFTIFLLRLESVLFSLAAFLSNCLFPLDLPTILRIQCGLHHIYEKPCRHANNNIKTKLFGITISLPTFRKCQANLKRFIKHISSTCT